MKYQIEVSEKQIEIIKIALEEYFRLRMNQVWDFADNICFEGFNHEDHTKEDFDELIERRNMFQDEFGKLLNVVHPLLLRRGEPRKNTTEMMIAQDIWQVIRHKLYLDNGGDPNGWDVAARKPMCLSGEPLPKMKEVSE